MAVASSNSKENPENKESLKIIDSHSIDNSPSKQSLSRISQSDIPTYNLDKALIIAAAIIEQYAGKPATPLQIAKVLKVQPNSSSFRMLCGASIAYGLTKGGYNAPEVTVEPLAKRILRPTVENDDVEAKVEAFLKPRIIKSFFTKYDNSQIPREDIAKNVLEEMGVPKDRVNNVYETILNQGTSLGIIVELKSKKYIELNNRDIKNLDDSTNNNEEDNEKVLNEIQVDSNQLVHHSPSHLTTINNDRLKKVFITHGKNTKFIEPIKKLLSFGELQPVISIEKTTISLPVPDKVMNDMRSCGAAIIHVEDELKLIDSSANEQVVINSNVLIEIGAAMALYGRRFILLVKDGIKLPSNLQGLFEVRYSGEELDGTATIKLLEAINDIKNQSLPN